MPILEYRCADCDEIFEFLRLSPRDTDVECPRCGGREAQQMLSVFAAHTSGRSAGAVECYNRSAGVCEAGGGAMT